MLAADKGLKLSDFVFQKGGIYFNFIGVWPRN